MNTSVTLTAGDVQIEAGSSGLQLTDAVTGQLWIDSAPAWPLSPVIQGQATAFSLRDIQESLEGLHIFLDGGAETVVRDFCIDFRKNGNALDCICEFRVERDAELNALEIFPSGAALNVYDIVNFRNRHFTAATWPELLVGGEFETSTYSDDWQFAPHPSALLLRKADRMLFAGFTGLQAGFGMRMGAKRFALKHWLVDFGAHPHGFKLSAGETFRSAPFRFFLSSEPQPQAVYAEFGRMLAAEKIIPDPADKVLHAWWREPLYCTWGDQWMMSEITVAESLAEQTAEMAVPAAEGLTEDLIWRAVEVIQKEQLPIRTIILDEGWAVARGDWRPHPVRLPNFRGIVDRLHAEGFKVMVWWNWAEIAAGAEVDERYLAGGGWKNKHGCRWRDYSDPVVQEEYFKPLFRTFFSADADCYDLDGVKTDFLADKVHPETPLADPAWRGEEQYFYKVTGLFYREMRRHKADACHLGCAGHYWLADFIDLNRTYDVHSSNWLEHEERARMLECTSPGAPVSYDMMTCTENTDRWFESARQIGASIELGNILSMRDRCNVPARPADAAYLAMLRKGLAANLP